MSSNKDDIEKIISELQNRNNNVPNTINEPLSPPQKREIIDFSKPDENKKDEPTKDTFNKKAKDIVILLKKIFNKRVLTIIGCIVLCIALISSVISIISFSKVAYLKPYEKKYPNAQFPHGILEEYCDIYGQNTATVGYLKIKDLDYSKPVLMNDTQPVTKGARQFNYVVYLNNSMLEEIYSTPEGYNSSSKELNYSNLFENYTFQVVGAFYTNTKASDDAGYIFPYNVTELMTDKSINNYIDRLRSRFIYTIPQIDIQKRDTVLTISSPARTRSNYRFVVVARLVEQINTNAVAKEKDKSSIHITQREYDELKIDNPYKYSKQWYPEIIIYNDDNTTSTKQQTIKDYN